MKLNILATTLTALPILTSGYMMGANMFGRPVVIRSFSDLGATGGPCDGPDCFSSQGWSDTRTRANFRRGGRRKIIMNEETIRQQKELLNRFFGLANEITSELSSSDKENRENTFRQQQEWVNRAFNIAQDVASGASSPRYEIDDTENMFQVVLDVPGVPASTIQVNVVEEKDGQQVLSVTGERQVGGRSISKDDDESSASRTAKFNKSFSLDSTVDADKITAQLNNGVLLISAPKVSKEEKTKKIPVIVVQSDDIGDELTVDVVSDDENDDSSKDEKEDSGDSNKNSDQ